MLGFYSVESGMEIHVIDLDPYSLSRNGGLTDTSLIDRYKISDEAYDKRKGTVRDWIRKKKEADPFFKAPKPKGFQSTTAGFTSMANNNDNDESVIEKFYGPDSVVGMSVGNRCEVTPGGRRGCIRFIGEIEGMKSGYWVIIFILNLYF